MTKKYITLILYGLIVFYGIIRAISSLYYRWFYISIALVFLFISIFSIIIKNFRWNFPLHLGISFIFLDLTFKKTSWNYLIDFFSKIDYRWVIPIVLSVWANLIFRGLKSFLLFPEGKVKISHLIEAVSIGFMVNNILPARAGEVVRAFIIADRSRLSKSYTLTTIFLERVIDGVALTCFFVILILTASFDKSRFAIYSYIAVGFYTIFLIITLLFYFFKPKFERIIIKIIHIFKLPFEERLRIFLDRIYDGLHLFKKPYILILFFILTLINWSINHFVIWLCCRSVNYFHLVGITNVSSYIGSLLLLLLICFAISVPSGPGGAGPYQYIVQLTSVAMNPAISLNSKLISISAGFSIYIWLVQSIPLILIGLIFYLKSGYSIKSFKSVKD